MNKIAVTGASGFVGRQIVRALIQRGHVPRLIVRSQSNVAEIDSPAPEIVRIADLFSESTGNLIRYLKGIDTLIHAAWYAVPGEYLDSRKNLDCLAGTWRLAEAFHASGGRRFIGIGTCAEYDTRSGVLSTDTPLKPVTLYASCKASAFQILSALLPENGIEFAWCRLFYLYGEGEDPRRLVPYLRNQLTKGEPAELTSGNQIRDFIDVKTAGGVIAETALSSCQGPVNVCSGIPVTVRQFAERVADEYGRRHLLRFGARPENRFDPPCVVGVKED
jgi:dTDP-6-deoxy-L-talose 4-dehydrogenase (NAD+)